MPITKAISNKKPIILKVTAFFLRITAIEKIKKWWFEGFFGCIFVFFHLYIFKYRFCFHGIFCV